MDVCDDLPGILEVKENNVVDPFLNVSHALPANGDRSGVAQPVLNDANVVRREVPQSVDVGTGYARGLSAGCKRNAARPARWHRSVSSHNGWLSCTQKYGRSSQQGVVCWRISKAH